MEDGSVIDQLKNELEREKANFVKSTEDLDSRHLCEIDKLKLDHSNHLKVQ